MTTDNDLDYDVIDNLDQLIDRLFQIHSQLRWLAHAHTISPQPDDAHEYQAIITNLKATMGSFARQLLTPDDAPVPPQRAAAKLAATDFPNKIGNVVPLRPESSTSRPPASGEPPPRPRP